MTHTTLGGDVASIDLWADDDGRSVQLAYREDVGVQDCPHNRRVPVLRGELFVAARAGSEAQHLDDVMATHNVLAAIDIFVLRRRIEHAFSERVAANLREGGDTFVIDGSNSARAFRGINVQEFRRQVRHFVHEANRLPGA